MSAIPKNWRNVADKIEHVSNGDEISVEVEGGFIRGRAPTDGFMVMSRSGDSIFVPGGLVVVEEKRKVSPQKKRR